MVSGLNPASRTGGVLRPLLSSSQIFVRFWGTSSNFGDTNNSFWGTNSNLGVLAIACWVLTEVFWVPVFLDTSGNFGY